MNRSANTFLIAAATHFDLPIGQVLGDSTIAVDGGILTIKLSIMLTDEDLRAIGAMLAGPVPTTDTTTSPAGTEVQHADGEAQDEKIRYFWMTKDECTSEQRESAVGTDHTNNPTRYAIEVSNLADEQLAGRTVCEL